MQSNSRVIFFIVLALAIGGVVITLLSACSTATRDRVLRVIFDGVGKPPPTRRLRRDLLREIEQLKRELAEAKQRQGQGRREAGTENQTEKQLLQTKKWEEATKVLPKAQTGHVDWVAALKDGSIAPRPGVDGEARDQAVLDLPVEINSSRTNLFSVTYEHEPHTRWLSCKNCHPTIFPIGRKAKPSVITMAKMKAGENCGVCHGKVAFGVNDGCPRCHTGIPAKAEWQPPAGVQKPIEKAKSWEEAVKLLPVTAGTTDWVKALANGVIAPRPGIDPKAQDQPVVPMDVERVPAAGAMFKAVFPHQAHTAVLACPNCHTAIFQMAKGATPISMEKINAGEACGVCHGKVAFPATACGRCHPAMAGGK